MGAKGERDEGGGTLVEPGSMVDHFRVIRLLGRGGMGEVYLARDTKLGRRVALKVVRPDALATEDARERFLFEARVTARFAHPHIVTVHSVGEHQGSPYLALEYLEGENLHARCVAEAPALRESLRIAAAVAEALAEAHHHEVLHRDLKPENILLPKDGRPRVVDFGLAKGFELGDEPTVEGLLDSKVGLEALRDSRLVRSVETDGHVLVGTPPYMAPEQWRREPCTGATDVWALGVILFELLAGRTPFHEEKVVALAAAVCAPEPAPRLGEAIGVPDDVDELVSRCLSKDPVERPAAAEVAAELALALSRGRTSLTGDETPYRGLLPFTERHAGNFFGRDDEVAGFVERLRDEPLLAVVGPSGAGKSSFVRAGVVPRLREQGRWLVLTLRPGREPLTTLAGRVAAGWEVTDSSAPPDLLADTVRQSVPGGLAPSDRRISERLTTEQSLAQSLAGSPPLLSVVLGRLAEGQRSRVLLFVDQLEELFTLSQDEAEREAFLEAVCSAADDPEGPVRVVLTLREDFLGHVARSPVGRQALGQVTVLGTPSVEALEEIASRPLERVGYEFDDRGLPEEMAERVAGEPAALALLQFTCMRLWEERDREAMVVTRASYDALGGVEGALARHADRVVEGLASAQIAVAKQLLLRLVTDEGTRRVQPRSTLLEGLGPEAEEVLDRLTSWRAVMVRKGAGGEEADLELIHESLITRWDRLARWVEESREELSFLAEVGQAAELWERRGRRREEAWRGPALQEARFRAARCAVLPETVRRFLEAGESLERGRARRRQALVAAVIVGLAAVAVVLLIQWDATREAHDVARRGRAEALVEGARAAMAAGDPLEARAKLRSALEIGDSALGRILWWQLRREPRLWSADLPTLAYAVAVSPDGSQVAAGCAARSVYVIDVATRRTRVLRGHDDQVMTVAYSPDGAMLASGDISGTVVVWDLATERRRRLRGHTAVVNNLLWSADGTRLVSTSRDATARMWNARTGAPESVFSGHESWVVALWLSDDGRTLRTASQDGTVREWSVGEGGPGRVLHRDDEPLACLAAGPGGALALCAGREVRLVDPESGEVRGSLVAHRARVTSAVATPEGETLVSADEEGRVLRWDLATGSVAQELSGRGPRVRDLDVGGGGRLVASAAEDGTVSLWALDVAPAERHLDRHEEQVEGISFAPDGRRVASGGYDGRVLIWDVASGEVVAALPRFDDLVGQIAFDPAGETLAVSVGETVGLWDATGLVLRRELEGHAGEVWAIAWSPDGSRLATGSREGELRLWNVAEGSVLWRRGGFAGPLAAVAWSPDGASVVMGTGEGGVLVLDAEEGHDVLRIDGNRGRIRGVSFTPDGRAVVTGGEEGVLRVWDVETGEALVEHGTPGRIYSLDVSPDGRLLGAPLAVGRALLVDRETRSEVVLRGHVGEVNGVRFSADGRVVATSGEDQTVRLWDPATGRPLWRAPLLLRRPLELYTHRGWLRLDGDEPRPGDREPRAWRAAVEERGRIGAQSPSGELLCLATVDGHLELWDLARDERLRDAPLPGISEVLATGSGCVALARRQPDRERLDALVVPRGEGPPVRLSDRATAAALAGEEILLATRRGGRFFSAAGEPGPELRGASRATALARLEGIHAFGHDDGTIELVSTVDRAAAVVTLDDVPPSAVVRLVPGPERTLAAAFANGVVGLWSTETGARLLHLHLHGPAIHLLFSRERLVAASELGDHVTLDLSVLGRDGCEVLAEVRRLVPVVWDNGRPVPAEEALRETRCRP